VCLREVPLRVLSESSLVDRTLTREEEQQIANTTQPPPTQQKTAIFSPGNYHLSQIRWQLLPVSMRFFVGPIPRRRLFVVVVVVVVAAAAICVSEGPRFKTRAATIGAIAFYKTYVSSSLLKGPSPMAG